MRVRTKRLLGKAEIAKALAALAFAACAGCAAAPNEPAPSTVVVEPTLPVVPTGATLTVRWSLEGTLEPSACAASAAQQIEIAVVAPAGVAVGAFRQDCTSFATSIPLEAGTYAGRAVLLDADGQLRTSDVLLDMFTVENGEELVVAVDFPADVFLE